MSYQWKIILVAIAGTFMMMIDATIVNIALPHILAVFNETLDKMQFVTSAYLMAMAVSAPLATYLMTKLGVKRIYIASLILFLAGSMLCGFSWNTNSLIICRIVQGASSGVLMPLAMTLIFTNVPPEGRGTAMGLFGIPMVLAPAIGVTLGGYLVEYLDWRWCFYVNVPIVIVAVIISILWIKDTPKNATLPLDLKRFHICGCRLWKFALCAYLCSKLGLGRYPHSRAAWNEFNLFGNLGNSRIAGKNSAP
jgi:EmrB/QacA subfamily drug resistance transporter